MIQTNISCIVVKTNNVLKQGSYMRLFTIYRPSRKHSLSLSTVIYWSLVSIILISIIFAVSIYYLKLSEIAQFSNLSDVLNTIVGLPIAIAGTILAFYLALTAYNLTRGEIKRDNIKMFNERYGEASGLFVNIAMRITRLLSLSDAAMYEYQNIYTKQHDADHLYAVQYKNTDLSEDYKSFFTMTKNELVRVGFINELQNLEDDFVKLMTDPIASKIFLDKMTNYSIPQVVSALRGWGNIVQLETKYVTPSQIGYELFCLLSRQPYRQAFSFDDEHLNRHESSFITAKIELGELIIDPKHFAIIFFAALLDVRDFTSEALTEIDYKSLINDNNWEDSGIPIEQQLDAAKLDAIEARMIKRVEIHSGVTMLLEIISAIPSSEKIASSIANSIGLEESDMVKYAHDKTNPEAVLIEEINTLKRLMKMHNLIDLTHKLGITSDFYPVKIRRYLFR